MVDVVDMGVAFPGRNPAMHLITPGGMEQSQLRQGLATKGLVGVPHPIWLTDRTHDGNFVHFFVPAMPNCHGGSGTLAA